MGIINIKAILGVSPCKKPKPQFFTITRGATAELRYDLYSKWFSFKDLEQLTFTFKQNKKLYWFNMFDYLVPTEDTEPVAGKVYYKNVTVIEDGDGHECTAVKVVNPEIIEAGFYEVVDIKDYQNSLYYVVDSHFYHEFSYQDGYDYISFILASEETKEFKATSDIPSLLFETTVRINTDSEEELALRDSVIVEPHPPIVVKDCLYSQID